MPECVKCGSYTKYKLCYDCYSKKDINKNGTVYIAEITLKNGSKKIYVGHTKRKLEERIKEHEGSIRRNDKTKYVGNAIGFRLIGSLEVNDCKKAEKAIKKMPRKKKIDLAEGKIEFSDN